MQVAITGGTGFMGSHLARRLVDAGHHVVLISRGRDERDPAVRDLADARFVPASVSDAEALEDAFAGCDTVAHLAGINMERGAQTYEAVHVRGTQNVVDAAASGGVSKIILSSFLRARPDCGSAYHESKWATEEIVRGSELDYTVFKPGVTYGQGDHMLDHLSRTLVTSPVFALVGFADRWMRPLAIEDFVDIMVAALVDDRLPERTVPVLGPERLTLNDAVRRVRAVVDTRSVLVPLPVTIHYGISWLLERSMEIPITTMAQTRILAEGIVKPLPVGVCEPPPADLEPEIRFSPDQIRRGLPELRRYGPGDLRW